MHLPLGQDHELNQPQQTPKSTKNMLRFTTAFVSFALAVAAVRAAGDHDWVIAPVLAYPQINFDEVHADNEVVFQYIYAGTLGATKTLTNTLYQDDCTTAAGASLTSVPDTATPGIFTVDVGIDEVRLQSWCATMGSSCSGFDNVLPHTHFMLHHTFCRI